MQHNYLINQHGSEVAVTLDGNILLTCDPSAGDTYEAINALSDNLKQLFGDAKEVKFTPSRDDWNWSEVIKQLGDQLLIDGTRDFYLLTVTENNGELEYETKYTCSLPKESDIDLFTARFLLGYYGKGNSWSKAEVFGHNESISLDSVTYNNDTSGYIEYEAITRQRYDNIAKYFKHIDENIRLEDVCFYPRQDGENSQSGGKIKAWLDPEAVKKAFPGRDLVMEVLTEDSERFNIIDATTTREEIQNQKMQRSGRHYGFVVGDRVIEEAFGTKTEGTIFFLGTDNNGGKIRRDDGKEMKVVLEYCSMVKARDK